ncbi:hypothetical protein LguiB_018969 [Lonicera macranthoides]
MMVTGFNHMTPLVLIVILLVSISYSEQLQSSQTQTLLRIQGLLNFPSSLSSWNNDTDFCNTEPSSSVTVVCYEETITQLHVIGNKRAPPLPRNFSIDSFLTTLVKLPNLKVLTLVSLGLWGPLPPKIARISMLEILNVSSNYFYGDIPQELSSLTNLQALALDDNMFSGRVPDELSSLSLLALLSMKNNSLNGSLPYSLGDLENLRVLALSHNKFSGQLPDLSTLKNLQVLDLENNSFGPKFPRIGNKIVTLVLRKNRFSSGIADLLQTCYRLETLDISFNRFMGPFPPYLFSLPSITMLNIEENRFTGMLLETTPCNDKLKFVDLSANLLSGRLPTCLLSDSKKRVVVFAGNCLANEDGSQHRLAFCRNEALAVGVLPSHHKSKTGSKAVIGLSISGAILGGIILVGLAFLVFRRVRGEKMVKKPPARLIAENASTGYTSKLLSDARYITQAMKRGALGLPAYRTFSLEELEGATSNFDTSTFMGEGSHGQMYRGQLKDGSLVVIRCLKMKRSHNTRSFMHHIELISKLRHQNLVSAIGHCFECYLDDSSVSRIFLVFEYVPNGTLRDAISGRRALTWSQRIAAAIGIAKGIQFLHTGIVPGVFPNNLKITDILLDQNLAAKISSYNLPLLTENLGKISSGASAKLDNASIKHLEKSDVYDLGVILFEMIVGRPFNTRTEVEFIKDQLQACIMAEGVARKSMSVVDPAVRDACSDESLKTMMEICSRCLLNNPADRPSLEDVLWNLQFAAQVQDACQSSDGSPLSPTLRLRYA